MSKRTDLPPLNPLHVFEVASRLGSFTKAAKELNVTQSAVSRQIATLEGHLNVMLFSRLKDGVLLSDLGEYYRAEISAAFARISHATSELQATKKSEPVRVRVYSTFAANWLIPRLPEFQARHPEIEIQMNTSTSPVDFTRDAADIAIQFGSDHWANAQARSLLPDVLQPVCSPRYAQRHGLHDSFRGSDDVKLIEAHLRTKDWSYWLGVHNMDKEDYRVIKLPNSLLAYQAAMSDMGIAMAQVSLVKPHFESGALVPVGSPVMRPGLGYFVIWPESISLGARTKAFVQWLSNEAREEISNVLEPALVRNGAAS
ncbi:LysR substrate-binding domain-containing protein [Hoeflea alexandrii]|uniref:LysR substrate-binding domain-containing protein n=1 Tax=Hoeflea alexandrii TaxID=288436 RepID=UPI0022AF165D|nr:LysR substrate-binding domain-containing protein [Hoeflea alexandrii]MCZ4292228.1 LysR substrate-binding domain-containing protein [Hoeflea alexandrii]